MPFAALRITEESGFCTKSLHIAVFSHRGRVPSDAAICQSFLIMVVIPAGSKRIFGIETEVNVLGDALLIE